MCSKAKRILYEEVDKFIDEKISLAADTITKNLLANTDIIISGTSYAKSKITNDDCILIYGYSSLVQHVLLQARRQFPSMHVIVVDSRPKLRGKQSLNELIKHNVDCTYVLINSVPFVMNKVSKVILGACALLANGYVMSAIGSSQIALVAKSFNVPVVVCCETYKFCEKVQTDALIYNELGNPLDLTKSSWREKQPLANNDSSSSSSTTDKSKSLSDWSYDNKEFENVSILNLTYDVTPPDLISCVVTDMGMLPCTSVPVVLRIKNRDNFLPVSTLTAKKAVSSTSNE